VRERALRALDDIDGGGIGTIHAACADLLRRHPREAGLDPAFRVDDGTASARLLDEQWSAFLTETLRAAAPQATAWRTVLAHADASTVLESAAAMLAKGIEPREGGDAAREHVAALVAELLGELEWAAGRKGLSVNAQGFIDALRPQLEAFLRAGPDALRDASAAAEFPAASIKTGGTKCEDKERVAEVINRAWKLAVQLAEVDEAFTAAVLSLAGELVARVRERRGEEGLASFDDLLRLARDILRDHPEVRRREQERIDALLLDEFQDTDPLQYEIAFLLAEDAAQPLPRGGDAWTARLMPGRLFIVGDPKQSIYRFRGADMAAYERAVAHVAGQGALVLTLVANFRSRREVLEPINVLCRKIIVEEPGHQPRYEDLRAFQEDAGEPRVEAWFVEAQGGAHAEDWRLAEARAIGMKLREWRREGRIRSYGDVAMLFRAMTDAAQYQRGLSEHGVPFVTEGGKSFMKRDEIVQAITLLRCLVAPHDGAALLAVLRSPSCGATDREIADFARVTSGRWTWRESLSAEDAARMPQVARTLRGLADLSREATRLPADEALRRVLAEPPADDGRWRPHLLALHAASHGGAQRVANLEKLVRRAEDLVRAQGLSLPQVIERLHADMRGEAEEGESPLADETLDAVRLMSVHAAKGLEFEVVILPDLARRPRPRAFFGVAAQGDLLALRVKGARNLASLVVEDEEARHEAAQDRRVLYVALTRAKERLILVNGDPKPWSNAWPHAALLEGWGCAPEDPGAAAQLLALGVAHERMAEPLAQEDGAEGVDVAALAEAVKRCDVDARVMVAVASRRLRSATGLHEEREAERLARPYVAASAGIAQPADLEAPAESGDVDAPPTRAHEPGLGRAIGIAVHAALELGAFDDAAALRAIGRRASALAAHETELSLATIEPAVDALLATVPGGEIAAALRDARILVRELPFLLRDHDGADWQGFIDLVIEKDGVTWVVDWKTDARVEPERHHAQLRLYAEAVRRWRGLDAAPRMALAYIAAGRWVEIGADGAAR
jgi:ATP-dependent helicase/nuclease subunit A